MKLLFDENLSRKLVVRLAELYPGSAHVSAVGLLESPDREMWEFAKAVDFVIVSTDSGLYELATTNGPPHTVVWLRRWAHPTRDAERDARCVCRGRPPASRRGRSRHMEQLPAFSRVPKVILKLLVQPALSAGIEGD